MAKGKRTILAEANKAEAERIVETAVTAGDLIRISESTMAHVASGDITAAQAKEITKAVNAKINQSKGAR